MAPEAGFSDSSGPANAASTLKHLTLPLPSNHLFRYIDGIAAIKQGSR